MPLSIISFAWCELEGFNTFIGKRNMRAEPKMLVGITAGEKVTIEKTGKTLKSIKKFEAPAKFEAPIKKEAPKTE